MVFPLFLINIKIFPVKTKMVFGFYTPISLLVKAGVEGKNEYKITTIRSFEKSRAPKHKEFELLKS
jgi:hypothetical protein